MDVLQALVLKVKYKLILSDHQFKEEMPDSQRYPFSWSIMRVYFCDDLIASELKIAQDNLSKEKKIVFKIENLDI